MEDRKTIRDWLEYRTQHTPDFVYCIYEDQTISFSTLQTRVNRMATGLGELGIKPGQHVAVMFGNHPDHIFTILALAALNAVWVPINVNLRGPSLDFILDKSACDVVIADAEFWNLLSPVLSDKNIETVIVRNAHNISTVPGQIEILDFSEVDGGDILPPSTTLTPDEIRCILFTSGTTGEPKGVLMTERMLKTCAVGAGIASEVRKSDVFLFWEPIYHSAGAQMCILALMEEITLAIVPKFSASRFWDQLRKYRATKIHYLGGILDILLKSPPTPKDQDHNVQLAFGAGCGTGIWRTFEKRFGVKINECYGLTEASGFSTVNKSGKIGSIGKPYPYFEILIVDDDGKPLGTEQVGEIIMRGKIPGVIMQGYLGNPEATANALRGEWLFTGDIGCYDEDGDFYFKGRKKDSIRRRGENISAWEVERVLNSHPKIRESAVIGVDADVGEQELKAFIICADGMTIDPLELIKWCVSVLPYYQIPRYVAFVDSIERTPTERIRKESLSKDITKCWDLESTDYRIEHRQQRRQTR
jgi:crotonobetaine/carnitine-CoA ligase